MARYTKRTLSADFKDHRPAMVPGIPAAITEAEIRGRVHQLQQQEIAADQARNIAPAVR